MDVITYALLKKKVAALSTKYGSLAEGFSYKGSVASTAALPETDNTAGDLYTVTGEGNARYLYDGEEWVNLDSDITDIKNAIDQKQDAPSSAGTAGQVLGLDSNLDPVWVNQSGGGDVSNCAPIIINTASGDIASFADGADNRQIRKIVGTIVPQQAAGTPSPDNPLPISGWTGANVKDTGKNLLGGDALGAALKTLSGASYGEDSNGRYVQQWGNDNHTYQYVFSGIKENTQYTLLFKMVSEGTLAAWRYIVVYTDGTEDFAFKPNDTLTTYKYVSLANKTIHSIYNRKITTNNCRVYYDESGLFEGVLDENAFEPYHGQTLPINWQTEAGTIYGGTVTLKEDGSADVVKTWTGSRLDALSWSYNEDFGIFVSSAINYPIHLPGMMSLRCTMYKPINNTGYPAQDLEVCFNSTSAPNNSQIRIKDTSCGSDVSAFVAKITQNNGFAAWELMSEAYTTYHFDNIGELYTYFGTNNVWIDTGSISECDYPADTKLYIDGLTAPDEDMIANANIASGKYFVVNNQLYLSTAAIAAGASIVPGTNCTATNLAEALNALNT